MAPLVLAGCGGDDEETPDPARLTGTWQAVMAEFASQESSDKVDIVADGGSARLILAESNADPPVRTFELQVDAVDDPPEVTTGTWVVDGDILEMTPTGMPFSWQFDVELSGSELRLSGASVEYDCDGDGTDDPATLNLEFERIG